MERDLIAWWKELDIMILRVYCVLSAAVPIWFPGWNKEGLDYVDGDYVDFFPYMGNI